MNEIGYITGFRASKGLPPNCIFLQWFEEDEEDITWCEDRINQNDVRYVRVGFLLELLMSREHLTRDDLLKAIKRDSSL